MDEKAALKSATYDCFQNVFRFASHKMDWTSLRNFLNAFAKNKINWIDTFLRDWSFYGGEKKISFSSEKRRYRGDSITLEKKRASISRAKFAEVAQFAEQRYYLIASQSRRNYQFTRQHTLFKAQSLLSDYGRNKISPEKWALFPCSLTCAGKITNLLSSFRSWIQFEIHVVWREASLRAFRYATISHFSEILADN